MSNDTYATRLGGEVYLGRDTWYGLWFNIIHAEQGWWYAFLQDDLVVIRAEPIPVTTQGHNIEEARWMLEEAIDGYLESEYENG